jgi:hypothetical protein
MTPYAKWTQDCGGKQDYDGPLIDISTRYWPATGGFLVLRGGVFVDPPLTRPSAHSAILLRYGTPTGGANYVTLREAKFEEDTEDAVKQAVEAWVRQQFHEIAAMFGVDASAEARKKAK